MTPYPLPEALQLQFSPLLQDAWGTKRHQGVGDHELLGLAIGGLSCDADRPKCSLPWRFVVTPGPKSNMAPDGRLAILAQSVLEFSASPKVSHRSVLTQ